MQLLLATQNPGKKLELIKLLSGLDIEVLLPIEVLPSLGEYPLESGSTFEENASIKAQFIFSKTNLPCIGDDSGLSVSSLDGFPGVKSARWLSGSDQDRNQELLNRLATEKNRQATFTTVICFISPQQQKPHYFSGTLEGSIAETAKGTEGFGYDPIFIPKNEKKTLAELGIGYKNAHSHRAQAIQKLKVFLQENVLN